MELRGRKRQMVYDLFTDVYHDVTGASWSWKKGEKNDVLNIFQYVAECMSLSDDEAYERVMDMYGRYLTHSIGDWFDWSKSGRHNLIGFVWKKENIELFVSKQSREEQLESEDSDMVGEGSPDSWDF